MSAVRVTQLGNIELRLEDGAGRVIVSQFTPRQGIRLLGELHAALTTAIVRVEKDAEMAAAIRDIEAGRAARRVNL